MRVAQESFPFVLGLTAISGVLWAVKAAIGNQIALVAAILVTLLTLFVAYFFRDPNREIPAGDQLIVSPADGRIVAICEDNEPYFMGGKALRVSIFLNIFNVHINRMPSAGTVQYKHHRPGKFWGAYRDKASEENEQTCIGLDCGDGYRMTVKQIAGFIARRIICHADTGSRYARGEKFGLICFGSRTDIFLPIGTPIKVKLGDKVSGGTTIIGEKNASFIGDK